MIRVDHAGERGADTIYNGQWDVLKDTESGDLIKVIMRAKALTMNRVSRWIFCQMGIFSICGSKKKSIWRLLNNY